MALTRVARLPSQTGVSRRVSTSISTRRARQSLHHVTVNSWTSICSVTPAGEYSAMRSAWRDSKSAAFSCGRTICLLVSPCWKALRLDVCLPAAVTGPVEDWALRRLASSWTADVMECLSGRLEHGGCGEGAVLRGGDSVGCWLLGICFFLAGG